MEDDDDWEFLHHDDSTAITHNNINLLQGQFSNPIIRSDYFSIHHINNTNTYQGSYVTEEGSVDSDNPSWTDPDSAIPYPNNDSAQSWSDSATHRSDQLKFGETQKSDSENSSCESELSGEKKEAGEVKNVVIEAEKSAGIEEEKKTPVWWKLPLELLKYCVFWASPVWSISVAAAVMGFVILGRRLYKMKKKKKKTRSLPLKVTLDDKKVSHFMSRAVRLNEAFSKRVPVIRPSFPAAGVRQWPVMSLT